MANWENNPSFLQWHELSIGPRYVFFKSLLQTQKIQSYTDAAKQANNYLQQAKAQLNPDFLSEEKNNVYIQTMLNYINMIKELADNCKDNEITFVENFEKILKEDKTNLLPAAFGEWASSIRNEFNYEKLISLIEQMLSQMNDFEKQRNQISLSNLQNITQKVEAAKEQFSKETYEKLIEGLKKHKYSMVLSILKNLDYDKMDDSIAEFKTQATKVFADKFNSIMINIGKSSELKEQIAISWSENWNEAPIQRFIIGLVVTYLNGLNYESLTKTPGEKMAKSIMSNFDDLAKNIDYKDVDAIINLMTGKAIKTIEEVALTSRAGIGQMFIDLTEEEQKALLTNERYKNNGLKLTWEKIQESLRNDEKKAKAMITKQLGEAIRKTAMQELGFGDAKFGTEEYQKQKKRVEALIASGNKFFQERELKSIVQRAVNIKVSGPSMAEFFASKRFRDSLKKAIEHTPGTSIKLKTDAAVTFSYSELDLTGLDDQLGQELKTSIDSFQKDFLQTYNKRGKGTTDVAMADEAFQIIMNGIRDKVDDIVKDTENEDERRIKILETLNSYVNTSISVKEYTYGNNQIGFSGGSLGPRITDILKNIDDMYLLGGITPVDSDLLYFVVINCGPDTIADGLKDNVANYLIGAAAMMMFDDGFAASNAYIEYITKQFGFMPKVLQLYNIQGRFIPASLVYSVIYNNLITIYQDIVNDINTFSVPGNISNSLIITNNITEENSKPDIAKMKADGNVRHFSPFNLAQERFNTVAGIAAGTSYDEADFLQTTIEFNFLAGILDLFEAIPKAFANI